MENQQPSLKSRFRRVCVFCGSSPGKNPSYQLAAIQLGHQLSDTQDSYAKRDNRRNSGEVRAVSGMHQRKAEMARQADAFIALPGGYGTLEELLEVITWAQLGIHDKPVGLLNVDGYYNSLLSFIDKAVDEGFITPSARHIIVSAQSAHELMCKLETFVSSSVNIYTGIEQEYEPRHSGVASKLSWEMEQQLGYTIKSDIAR
ncbi:hypothetical protein GH714_006541 [Hevea brasiliensis]|uniref:Cytokinin riboside 5'-monophosphate phosphoribohydrolase n=1 Tax=Hevea brasiliensis TaxID=3981 RepID=A0A6A6MDQ3_HEVBR|nr:hypothetical protein GH714_006541 [Hevea brasiliensis]